MVLKMFRRDYLKKKLFLWTILISAIFLLCVFFQPSPSLNFATSGNLNERHDSDSRLSNPERNSDIQDDSNMEHDGGDTDSDNSIVIERATEMQPIGDVESDMNSSVNEKTEDGKTDSDRMDSTEKDTAAQENSQKRTEFTEARKTSTVTQKYKKSTEKETAVTDPTEQTTQGNRHTEDTVSNEEKTEERKDSEKNNGARDSIVRTPEIKELDSRRKNKEIFRKRLPSALIIGAKKCGTSALVEMLNIHPDVKILHIELHFFDLKYNKGLKWYQQRMPFTHENQITIEKSPRYFVTPEAPARIKDMDPNIKLLLIVRNPTVRIISDYVHLRAHRKTNLPFLKLILRPNGEINPESEPVQVGQYVTHLQRYLKFFDRHQIHVVNGEALIDNPYPEIKKVEAFLNLRPRIEPSNFYYSRSKGFYCMRRGPLEECLGGGKGRHHPDVDPQIISALRRYYAPYNEQFYNLIGQNFSWPTS